MEKSTKRALWIGGVVLGAAAVATGLYAVTGGTAKAATGGTLPPQSARSANALDYYTGTLIPPSGLLIGNIGPNNFSVAGATVTSITGTGTSLATVQMTAPPGMTSALSAALAATAISLGYTTGPVVDTGVMVP